MFLTGINLLKVFILKMCENRKDVSVEELKCSLKVQDIKDVSYDLFSKMLNVLVTEKMIEIKEEHCIISPKGKKFYEENKENLLQFAKFLEEVTNETSSHYSVPSFLDEIVAYKTVPYRFDSLGAITEDIFFSNTIKENKPYCFDNRGLGKARFSLVTGRDAYSYDEYGILFVNAGAIQFIGIVSSYNNELKELHLEKIIKIKNPISILDIREGVRTGYNGSQQKQEFVETTEVKNFTKLIKDKIRKNGCVVYSN